MFCGSLLSERAYVPIFVLAAFGEPASLAFLTAWLLLGRAVELTPHVLEASPLRPLRLAFLASAFGYAAGFALTAYSILSPWGSFAIGVVALPLVAVAGYVPLTYAPIVATHGILFGLAARDAPGRVSTPAFLGVALLWLATGAGLVSQFILPAGLPVVSRWIGLVGLGYAVLAAALGRAVRLLSGAPSPGPAALSRGPSP